MNELMPQFNNNKRKQPNRIGTVVLLLVVIVTLAIAIYEKSAAVTGNSVPKVFHKPSDGYIAAIHIDGVIETKNSTYDQKWLLDTISNLEKDENNTGIFLVINSPGGGVYQADEAYLSLLKYKEKTHRPIYAYMESLAASGGYYIACAADKIIANRNTLTGSIGVIAGQSVDLTELFEKWGIKYTTITAGKNKNMGNYNQPLTEEQHKIMQSIADECYEQFTTIVSTSRNLDIEKTKTLADGRIYTANQALHNGLIDGIYSWNEAVIQLETYEFGGQEMEVTHYRPDEKKSLYKYIMEAASFVKGLTASTSGQLPSIVVDAITPKTPYPAYLYTGK